MSGRLPNLIIAGAAKCGTTSFWAYLRQHPEVFLSKNKEPNYFALGDVSLPKPGPLSSDEMQDMLYAHTIKDFERYQSLFSNANEKPVVGEASVRYLYYYEKAASRIKEALPDVKILIFLRDPVKRLYSHYCMNRQYGIEPLSLMEAVAMEDVRVRLGWGYDWHYRRVGMYSGQVRHYLDLFGRERVKVVVFEEFAVDPGGTYRDVCRFLAIDDSFEPDFSQREKSAYLPKILPLDRLLNPPGIKGAIRKRKVLRFVPGGFRDSLVNDLVRWNRQAVASLREFDAAELRKFFAEDIKDTEECLGRQLNW